MIAKLAAVALLAFTFPFAYGQTGGELPCGMTSSIKCTDPTTGKESCKFDQRAWGNKDGCFETVKITAQLCNEFLDDKSGPVKVTNANTAIELSGNALSDKDVGMHGFTESSELLLFQGLDKCVTKVFEIEVNVCKKRYNIEINADAETPGNKNCRKYQFKSYSNKKICKVSTSTTCTVNESKQPCDQTTYTRDTCGVKLLDFEFEMCNLNTASIRPVLGTTKATLGRTVDDGYLVPIDKGDIGPGECSTISRSREVNTCVSFAPNGNTLLNAKVLKNGKPDTINNQHCYSNKYLPGHNWNLLSDTPVEPTKEPTVAPTPTPGFATECDEDTPGIAPASGKGSKGCSKGSKGSKSSSGARRQRKRVRERRNL